MKHSLVVVGMASAIAACPIAGCGTADPPHRAPRATTSTAASATLPTVASARELSPTIQNTTIPGSLLAKHQRLIDTAVQRGIDQGEYPGAVVLVLRDGHTAFVQAYGQRALKPHPAEMTTDTVFDLASLTKPIATATAILILRDRGKLALNDRVAKHLPGCRLDATIADLLTHRGGLPPANHLKHYKKGRAAAVRAICESRRGKRKVRYSDLGHILLAELVATIAKQPFDAFCREAIFEPLGMKDTSFKPKVGRVAPTVGVRAGTVHDPRAALLDGVAGNAGLFSTAADLGRWVNMLLFGGKLGQVRILSQRSSRDMLRAWAGTTRSLGLARSIVGGFGHTGFTGTSVWLEPSTTTGLVILASRLHPGGQGSVKILRQEVRKAVLVAMKRQSVRTGADVLNADKLNQLAGRRVGLITHASATTRSGQRVADLMHRAPDVKLVALFSPEHGMTAGRDGAVPSGRDAATGVPIHSLYGKHKRPTAAHLSGIDTLAFDLQSIGARFYTYVTTLGYALEAAAQQDIELIVLDRPNPIGAEMVEGPILDEGRRSFVGYHAIPVRHGMTVGELARLFNAERKIGARLKVIEMTGYRRADLFTTTGLAWTNPSPNIRHPDAAVLYPGLALLEMTNVSVGRGTAEPFMRVGAPWLDPDKVITELRAASLEGIAMAKETFTPTASKHANTACSGIRFTVTKGSKLRSVRLGIALAAALRKHHRNAWSTANLITLLGDQHATDAILSGKSVDGIEATWSAELDAFMNVRSKYLLY